MHWLYMYVPLQIAQRIPIHMDKGCGHLAWQSLHHLSLFIFLPCVCVCICVCACVPICVYACECTCMHLSSSALEQHNLWALMILQICSLLSSTYVHYTYECLSLLMCFVISCITCYSKPCIHNK